MRQYELMLLVHPDADEERLGAVVERVRRVASDHGGGVVSEDNWGRRKLAYKIGRFTEANYHMANIEMEGTGTTVLDNSLKLADDVIRHLLIRKDEE